MVDPTKLMLTTPGIDPATGEYQKTGIPATILATICARTTSSPRRTT